VCADDSSCSDEIGTAPVGLGWLRHVEGLARADGRVQSLPAGPRTGQSARFAPRRYRAPSKCVSEETRQARDDRSNRVLQTERKPIIMRTSTIQATSLAAAGVVLMGVLYAPAAEAAPDCTRISPATTHCETNGSNQIQTEPRRINVNPGWPWWF